MLKDHRKPGHGTCPHAAWVKAPGYVVSLADRFGDPPSRATLSRPDDEAGQRIAFAPLGPRICPNPDGAFRWLAGPGWWLSCDTLLPLERHCAWPPSRFADRSGLLQGLGRIAARTSDPGLRTLATADAAALGCFHARRRMVWANALIGFNRGRRATATTSSAFQRHQAGMARDGFSQSVVARFRSAARSCEKMGVWKSARCAI